MADLHREGHLFVPAARLVKGSRIGVYGAGTTGRKVLEALRYGGFHVEFLLDQAGKRLRKVAGVPVLPPFPNRMKGRGDPVPVVLAIFNRDVDTVAIARRLSRSGYGPLVSYLDFHFAHRAALGEHFWLGDPALVGREFRAIEAVGRLWADERSRVVFRTLVDLYASRDPQRAPRPSGRDEEYLAPDIPGWPPATPVRLVDCGAYDGDTLERFRAARVTIEAAACFEPDPENFSRLQARVSRWPAAQRRNVSLWPSGVAGRTGVFSFEAGLGESSRLVRSAGTQRVACVALDDVLSGFSPNLLKLDVEGAEESALRGATKLIRDHRPGLAVSVYHRPADLWRLPAQIHRRGLGYRLFLRSYGFNGFDTICYAVPGPEPLRARPAPARRKRQRTS